MGPVVSDSRATRLTVCGTVIGMPQGIKEVPVGGPRAPRYLRAGTRNVPLLERNFLHAARIGFSHPSTDAWVEVRAPLPKDLRVYFEQIADCLGRRDAERVRTVLTARQNIDAALAPYL